MKLPLILAMSCLALGLASTQSSQVDDELSQTLSSIGRAGLPDNERGLRDSLAVLRAAGRSGDPSLLPLLETVALRAGAPREDAVGLSALHAIWRIEQNSPELMDLALGATSNSSLTANAVRIAAR